MKKSNIIKLMAGIFVCLVSFGINSFAAAGVKVTNLRCEYLPSELNKPEALSNPIVLTENQKPRLSWTIESTSNPPQRGIYQSAYRIIVASSLENLKRDIGDLWDTGKVNSGESTHIEYIGKPLKSGQDCFWKVMVWDQDGNPSQFSEPARWTIGLLKPSDWKAKWITYDFSGGAKDEMGKLIEKLSDLKDCNWVLTSDGSIGNQAPGNIYFRKTIEIPQNQKIVKAQFVLTADDGFTLYVNEKEAGQGTSWKNLYAIDVTQLLKAGKNVIGIRVNNAGTTPSPAGLIGKLVIIPDSDKPVVIPIDTTWKAIRQRNEGNWRGLNYDDSAWQPAKAIAKFGEKPWGEVKFVTQQFYPAPFFRKSFTVTKPVKRAIAFVSALGLYEFHFNGKVVSNDVFGPGWTDYSKRVHYFAYDLTKRINKGENVIGAIVGDGWYAGYLAFTGRRHYYGQFPHLITQLHIEYADGTEDVIATDGSWKCTTGPIVENDLLMGCVYDARLELDGWDSPKFDDSKWKTALVDSGVQANLEAHPGHPIRRMKELKAIKLTEPKPGVYVFDLGQNMVGWVRLYAKGEPGQKVVVRHAEMLNPDGTIYTANLRSAKATDTYYLEGKTRRAYEPYFTFHGFRYVEVTGLDYKPSTEDVVGIVVYSGLQQTGHFECSEPLVNRLHLNTIWGQAGNFLDVPTDCPQRDERAGWTGDAQVFMKTACLNMDAPAFFTKWLVDLCEDSQNDQGGFGDVAPYINIVGFGNTGWSDAGVVCNWQMYRLYGDTHVVRKHYRNLLKYMDYLERTSKNYIRGTGAYGDWLRLAGPQHSDAIGTAYYYYTTKLMIDLAAAIDRKEDVEKFKALADKIKAAYQQNFIKEDGSIVDSKGQTGQTLYALAFALELVPENLKQKAAEKFIGEIKKQNGHLATGFLGTPVVLFALEKAGYPDWAYRLVLNKTYPSWLQQVIWGSTTMWERWDGWTPEKGFQDPGMNSFNHYWLGCVGEWLYTKAAGIDALEPGFSKIIVRPLVPPKDAQLTNAKASYDSIRGRISSAWSLKDKSFTLTVEIPVNTKALVYVPASSEKTVKESNKPIENVKGVKFIRMENNYAVFEVESGHYEFTSEI
jgi:alpha-L-rhamnosidase